MTRRLAHLLLVSLSGLALTAQDKPDKPDRRLDYQTGKVTVAGKVASLDLPDGWRYLQQGDARYVVEKLWGNPPDPEVLGMVTHGDELAWGIIVEYEASGHVKDDDAAGLNYGELLTQMQEDAKAAGPERKKRGYPTVELLGWAEPPHYDAKEKKIYWAKSLRFEGSSEPTLNYDVRVLGADGVLVMRAVAGLSDLDVVAKGAKEILTRTELAPGKRYEDHDPSLHKVAAYGIGGLIAGKVLLKAGLLKALAKPLLVVGALVVGAIGRLFGKKKKEQPAT